jgi:hypothetical protein
MEGRAESGRRFGVERFQVHGIVMVLPQRHGVVDAFHIGRQHVGVDDGATAAREPNDAPMHRLRCRRDTRSNEKYISN